MEAFLSLLVAAALAGSSEIGRRLVVWAAKRMKRLSTLASSPSANEGSAKGLGQTVRSCERAPPTFAEAHMQELLAHLEAVREATRKEEKDAGPKEAQQS